MKDSVVIFVTLGFCSESTVNLTSFGIIAVLLKPLYIVSVFAVVFATHLKFLLSVPLKPRHVYLNLLDGKLICDGRVILITIPCSKFFGTN
jgi:hypothetical protein